MVNLRALHLLSEENPNALVTACEEQGLDPVVAQGVVILLLANDGNLASLSQRQREHYDLAIGPLLT